MKLTTRLAIATAFAALTACSGNNNANNTAAMNAGTDLNAGSTDMNATDMNAGGMTDMNSTGNTDLNAGGGTGMGATNGTGNAGGSATNNRM